MADFIEKLKTLADTNRLRILSLIWEAGDLCSCEVEKILDMQQSNTSRQLNRLQQVGFLHSYKKAQWAHYRIAEEHRPSDSLTAGILSRARASMAPLAEDIEKLHDYRDRGFSCQTIHQWVPFEGG